MHSTRFAALFLLVAHAPLLPAQEPVDTAAVRQIREEAFQRSQVMEIASWLTDVYGPRLTNSPTARAGGEWAVQQLAQWGLQDARLEPWGYFGRGWTNEKTSVQVTAPTPFPVIAYPAAWTPGTNGPVSARAVLLDAEDSVALERYRGRLRGTVVLMGPTRPVPALWEPLARRLTEERLDSMAAAPLPRPPGGGPQAISEEQRARMQAAQRFTQFRQRFLTEQGVVAIVQPGRGDGGNVFVGGGGSRDPSNPSPLPVLVTAIEHYGRMARTLEKGIEVRVELDVRNTFHDQDLHAWNVLAEIPGTDKADEVVMLGAHFDTWHAGTGATDNTAGSAVMMEAVRILKALNLPLRRTVRIALWTGEEQGLLGSRAYVRRVFGDAQSPTAAHGKFSVYFNVDNGTGAIRGVYLQGNAAVRPIFEAWMRPFADKGVRWTTLGNTGGTDHLAFDAVGLPGFQFIQDPVEYSTRTHHSSQDVWERLQAEDLMLNAAVVAAFVYHAANRAELLPRKGPLTQ